MLTYLCPFGGRGTSHLQLPALGWGAVSSGKEPLPLPVCSVPHSLFHHFCSIINTERLFFIETVLPKGFFTSSLGYFIFLLSELLRHIETEYVLGVIFVSFLFLMELLMFIVEIDEKKCR